MPEQAAQQGHAAIQGGSRPSSGPSTPKSRASSRSTFASSKSSIIGVGVAGALLTAAAIAAGAIMMTGSDSVPVTTQLATVSTPSAIAPTSTVAPAIIPAPVGPAQAAAPAIDVAPPLSPVAAPVPAPPAPPLRVPGQCEIGQVQQLALDVSATQQMEVGNVIRIFSGSYVSPPIVVTRSTQTVTFPAPPGSSGSARIIVEQKTVGGWTFEEEANGITSEVERNIDAHRDLILLRWTTPRC